MPAAPQSQYYHFETCISQNDVTESWIAEYIETGKKCFLKIEAENPSLGQSTIRSALSKSLECQASLKNNRVNTAISKRIEKGRLIIEYPYIDPKQWYPLTPDLFWKKSEEFLPQICSIVDYLHLLGMVHCDLKLENFMARIDGDGADIILADLDFLRPDYSPLKGEIIGTPEYIAPEVLANEIYTSQSDIYSLGMSLQNFTAQIPESEQSQTGQSGKFNTMIAAMTEKDPVSRPSMLLDLLKTTDSIVKPNFEKLNIELFKIHLSSSWKSDFTDQKPSFNQLQRFLSEKNRIFGIDNELQKDFVQAYNKDPQAASSVAVSLLEQIEIMRFENCWHIQISDTALLRYFKEIDRITISQENHFQIGENLSLEDIDSFLNIAEIYFDNEKYLRAFALLKSIWQNNTLAGNPDNELKILQALVRSAVALNRNSEAVEYLSNLIDKTTPDAKDYPELLFKLAFMHIKSGNLNSADEIIQRGIITCEGLTDKRHLLEFQRLQGWVLSSQGEQDRALEILQSVAKSAHDLKHGPLIISTFNYLGSLYRRKGDFETAREYYMQSLKEAQNYEMLGEAVSSLTNLSMLSFEFAEYKQSVKYAKLALKSIAGPEDMYITPFLHSMLTLSFARIAEYDKAEYWNQKYLSHGLTNYNKNTFGKFYLDYGWIRMARGQILRAQENLTHAVHIMESSSAPGNLGKAYVSLGEVALFQGNSENCKKYLQFSREIFEKSGDTAALADIRLIELLNSAFNENKELANDLYRSMLELSECKSRYLAALAAYYILIGTDNGIISQTMDIIPQKFQYTKNTEAPLFEAVTLLCDLHRGNSDDFNQKVIILKSVYRTMHDSGQLFPALISCLQIAHVYSENSKFKLAEKFLKQAQNIAIRLRNQKQAELIESEIKSLPHTDTKKADSIELLHYISDIIKDLKNYERTLERLIQFAVDETGAERGVLLLRSDPQSELRSRAYINCDNESLKDIQDFSKSIPFHVSREQQPFIIDNAMTDSRTRGFKSIAIHNILSVICMPIFKNEAVIGVIYLDHHTIPALFEEDDITLITAMANLISMVLSSAMEFRTVSSSRDKMMTEMARLGAGKTFITQNPEMLAILERIPMIAGANSSVLLIGESGTGKEILCEMLHEMSLRKSAPLVKINCAAIPATLIESELFGVARHAATGVDERQGKFQAADGGTLFLDEIGDMPIETQSKVLRVLEYQEFEKVGSNKTITTDVRLIYATNRNLKKLVHEGKFREDLFYRINAMSIEIPPLRNRPEDIPILINYFINIMARDKDNPPLITAPVMDLLIGYNWPGNVRELKNLVEKFCILYSGRTIEVMDLPAEIQTASEGRGAKPEVLEKTEKMQIRKILTECDWNQSEAARKLGIPLSTLRRRIKKYKIKKI